MNVFDFYKLKNGVRVLLAPMSGVQSTSVGVYCAVGSRYETPEINGISHFLEHMVFKGTKKYPTTEDTSRLEGMGAVQNAWTDVYATSYWSKIPADKWAEGLDLVKDLALYPLFPKPDLEIERGVIIEEINRYEDRPDERVGDVMQELLYAPNTLGMRILGTAEVIRKVTVDDFKNYHHKHYVASNLVVVLAGKLDTLAVKKAIEAEFAQLPASQGPTFKKFIDTQDKPQVLVYPKDTAEQAHIELSFRALPADDPRRFALAVLNALLGSGLSSRLFREVREKRGLCYTIHSGQVAWSDTGHWGIYSGLNIARLEEAIKAILFEVGKVKTEVVPEKELSEAKEKLRGPLLFSAENPKNQMEYYAAQVLNREAEILSYDAVIDRLMQVTAEDIQKLSQDLFKPEKLNLAVVGPLKKTDQVKLAKLLRV